MLAPSPHRFDHLVVLMLENRSFDNLCGYLYEGEQPKHFIPDTDRAFRGVAGRDDLVNDDGGDPPTEYRVQKAPWKEDSDMFAPYPNSGEFYEPNINRQVYGTDSVSGPSSELPTENLMQGFVQDYIRVAEESKKWDGDIEVTPELVAPVLTRAADQPRLQTPDVEARPYKRIPEPKAHQGPISHLGSQIIELSAAVAGDAVPVLKNAGEAVHHLAGLVHRPGKPGMVPSEG